MDYYVLLGYFFYSLVAKLESFDNCEVSLLPANHLLTELVVLIDELLSLIIYDFGRLLRRLSRLRILRRLRRNNHRLDILSRVRNYLHLLGRSRLLLGLLVVKMNDCWY